MDSFDERPNGHAALGMRLRIEENLGVANVLLLGLFQVSPGKIIEVQLAKKHPAALVINVEKRLQIRELIGSLDLVRRFVWKVDAVPQSKFKHQLRLERALDMQVQLCFRHALDKTLHR